MNFFDWMNMNMIVDIAFLVFSAAAVWKLRSLQNKISKLELNTQKISELESDLRLTMKNPQAAKRLLKERQ